MRRQSSARNVLLVVLAGICSGSLAPAAIGQCIISGEVGPRFDIMGSVVEQPGNQLPGNTYYPSAVNFQVKFCVNSDGTSCLAPNTPNGSGLTNSNGAFELGFSPGSQVKSQNYWMFAWRDDIYWGSSTQSVASEPIFITYWEPDIAPFVGFQCFLGAPSRPRPKPPSLVAPVLNSMVPYNQPITLQWTPETDPQRLNSNWPIVYDIYTAANGGTETLLAANVACSFDVPPRCTRTVPAGGLPAGSSVLWRAVAKMNTKVGAPGDPNYSTSSSKFAFNTSPPDDFSIAVSPLGTTLNAGTSTQFAVQTATIRGPAQTITFSVADLPSGVTGGFSANPVTAGSSSILTLTAVGNAPSATTTFTVTGKGTTLSHSVKPSLTVVANSFSLSVNPASQSIDPGQSTSYTVSSALVSGQAQTISLSVSGLPSGASWTLNNYSVTAGQNSTLAISTTSSIAPGTYPFTVLGTAASGSVTSTGYLIVNVPRMQVILVSRVRVPAHIVRGSSATGTVEMSAAAPSGGLTVSLASSNPSVASVPASVFVPAGATVSNPFTVTTSAAVSTSTLVTITATYQGSSTTATFYVDPSPTVSIAWIKPAEVTWGPAGTLTVAGYAQNGTGGVTMYWQDATAGGGWNVVGYVAPPDATNVWYNTIPSSNNCHTYEVFATYSGVTSSVFTYNGLTSGYCNEAARVIWIQPQTTAGFGPPGSLIIAGSASGAPSGTGVTLLYRDVTAGGGWNQVGYVSPPDGSNIWYNSFPADFSHAYSVYIVYDALSTNASPCTYAGNGSITWCP